MSGWMARMTAVAAVAAVILGAGAQAQASPAGIQYQVGIPSAGGSTTLSGVPTNRADVLPPSMLAKINRSGLSDADQVSLETVATSPQLGAPPATPEDHASLWAQSWLLVGAIALALAALTLGLVRAVRSGALRRMHQVAASLTIALTLAAGGGVALIASSPADARVNVPAGFWGVDPQVVPSQAHFERTANGGVDVVRFGLPWSDVQATKTGGLDWSRFDPIVAGAAKAHLQILPFIYSSPAWIAKVPNTLPVSGSQPAAWTAFLKEAVQRYGPGGTFWTLNPQVPKVPIRTWQIWNEANFFYFVAHPNPAEYGRLVKISSKAIKSEDPGASIILAGLFGTPRQKPPKAYSAADFLRLMYKRTPGIKASFDGIGLHPYVLEYSQLTPLINDIRSTVKKAGDPTVGLYITEMGWGSQGGKRATGFEKGAAGQVEELKGSLSLLLANLNRWHLKQVYWFSLDDYTGPDACNFCDSTGLFTESFKPKASWTAFVKFTGGKVG